METFWNWDDLPHFTQIFRFDYNYINILKRMFFGKLSYHYAFGYKKNKKWNFYYKE